MRSTVFTLVLVLMLNVSATPAAAQTPRFSTVLWAACEGAAAAASTDDRPISLHEVAVRARPALWFSRDEPLIDLGGPLPREWPRRQARATPEDLVYYRITKIKSASSDGDLARAFQERMTPALRPYVTAEQANPEAIADLPLDVSLVRELKEVVIRYLFYYPNELGAHSHVHDLESVELRIVFEGADERGDPRATNPLCQQIRVATLFGAAHGLGLYTNMLDLDVVLLDRLDEATQLFEATSIRTPVAPGPGGAPAVQGGRGRPAAGSCGEIQPIGSVLASDRARRGRQARQRPRSQRRRHVHAELRRQSFCGGCMGRAGHHAIAPAVADVPLRHVQETRAGDHRG